MFEPNTDYTWAWKTTLSAQRQRSVLRSEGRRLISYLLTEVAAAERD